MGQTVDELPPGFIVEPDLPPGFIIEDAPEQGVLSRAAGNIPSSALKYAKDVTQIIRHPIDTAKSFYDLALGTMSAMNPLGDVGDVFPAFKSKEEAARGAAKHYKDRYGSVDAAKEAFATDPVGVMADASLFFTGGAGVIPSAGKVGKASRIAQKAGDIAIKAGQYLDPMKTAGAALRGGKRLAGKGLQAHLGLTTGAGSTPIRKAYEAGRAGGAIQDDLTQFMRHGADDMLPMTRARDALTDLNQQKGAAYRAGMKKVGATGGNIDFAKIDKIYSELLDQYTKVGADGELIFKGGNKMKAKFADINGALDQFRRAPELRTAADIDWLKGSIADMYEPGPLGVPVTRLSKTIRSEIIKEVPEYAKVMKDYELRASKIKGIEQELSLGRKANPATTLRKLQGGVRDNVNTSYGARTAMIDDLDPGLMTALSGQALNSWTPRGLQGAVYGAGTGSIAAGLTSPTTAIPAIGMMSPRLMGEGALLAGQTGRYGSKLAPAASFAGKAGRYSRPLIAGQDALDQMGLLSQ